MGFLDGSGISWTICKQSAPRFRQITTPTPHHSIFSRQDALPDANKQCQSTGFSYLRSSGTVHITLTELSLVCRVCELHILFNKLTVAQNTQSARQMMVL